MERKTPTPQKAPPRPRRRWLRILVLSFVGLSLVGALAAAGVVAWAFQHYGKDLPDISWAEDYRPPIVSDVVSGDDQLLGEFYNERRRVVPYERMPKKLVQAFIAAEDERFFDHFGLDVTGIARAAIKNFLAGRKKGGGSTLTQQTAKAILMSTWGYERATEKTYKRKIYEAILAIRLEKRFSKEEILHLYLNQVFLGHHSYGVQAAAENYFRKNVWDLTLPEIALLAGLPQAPSRYSPFRFPERAKERRRYVLRRMVEAGMITQVDHDSAIDVDVKVHPVEDVFRETAPYVTEHVRRDVVARYGNERLLNDGLRIYTTVDRDLEREAIAATLKGIIEADKRQGYRGPLMKLEPKTDAKVWTDRYRKALADEIGGFRKLQQQKGAAPESVEELAAETWVGVVSVVTKTSATVGIGTAIEGTIPLDLIRWARKPNSEQHFRYVQLDSVEKALEVGDVVLVRAATQEEIRGLPKRPEQGSLTLMLEQEAKLQGALVSIDPRSGYIVAMIGGYDFNKSEFNRAFQACRQPGSSFKPLVYSAALEKLGWTPATLLLDAPLVFDDPENATRWKPSNYDRNFKGDVTLREAVINSMNLPAVRTLEAVGAREAAKWSNHLGISAQLNEDLSLALGSSCVTLWDLTHVYGVFNQHGRKVKSTFLRRVVDRDGRVLEDHSAFYDPWTDLRSRISAGYAQLFEEREQLIDETTAFVTTHLLEQVCRVGTAASARRLGRNVAGKTGTTNDQFDAWFVGYSPELVTGVWVGYDTYETPMGRYETGGRTALPIWIDFMGAALKGRPNSEFSAPEGIVWVNMDPSTGKLAREGALNSVRVAFKAGTEPTETLGEPMAPSNESFFGGDL